MVTFFPLFKIFLCPFFHGLAELQPQYLWLCKRESEGLLNSNAAAIKCEGRGAVQVYGNINEKLEFLNEKMLVIGRKERNIRICSTASFSLLFFKAAQRIFGSQVTLSVFAAPFCVSADLALLPQHDQHSFCFFFCII